MSVDTVTILQNKINFIFANTTIYKTYWEVRKRRMKEREDAWKVQQNVNEGIENVLYISIFMGYTEDVPDNPTP